MLLEVQAAGKAALRRTADDIIALQNTLAAYEEKVRQGQMAVEEDLLFHIKIAEASGNSVLKSLMMIITPDILKSFNTLQVCNDGRSSVALEEHKDILEHIIRQDETGAKHAMRQHLNDIINFSKTGIIK